MSHELRTPLNAIIGFSELLQMQTLGELNEQRRVYVDDVLEAGRHLLALINDILDLSKVRRVTSSWTFPTCRSAARS
jgi:signal transduction histidine kinase